MYPPRKILVIDHNPDSGSLLIRSLARKFPDAIVQLCKESMTAVEAVTNDQQDAVVLHRTEEHDAVSLIRTLRKLEPHLVIVAVSGVDRSEQVLAAGATGFLNYDQWLLLGNFVASALSKQQAGVTASRNPFSKPASGVTASQSPFAKQGVTASREPFTKSAAGPTTSRNPFDSSAGRATARR